MDTSGREPLGESGHTRWYRDLTHDVGLGSTCEGMDDERRCKAG